MLVETVRDDESTVSPDDVTVPIANPGHRSKPMEWDELVNIISVQKDLSKLTRSEEQHEKYERFWDEMLAEYATVTDYLLCERFPKVFTKQMDDATERYVAYPPLKDFVATGRSNMAVVRNEYPYNMAAGIEHWILWKVGDDACSESDIDHAKSLLDGRLDATDMLHWVNPPFLKSLPEIDHIHIIGKVIDPDAHARGPVEV